MSAGKPDGKSAGARTTSSAQSADASATHPIPRWRELPRPVELEEEVLRFWKEEHIFEKSLEASRGRPSFVFYEGPPTANGTPHNGHVLTRVMKDLFPRYKSMRGFHVERMAGWDTHGLPVEVEVEKELGMRGGAGTAYRNAREAVLAYGLDSFSQRCIESVFRYTQEWETLTDRIGFWIDLNEAYVTYHREYVESVWWALAELHKKGLLYQGYKVVWWWPEGGTALSSGEVGDGYRDVDDPSVTVRFPVVGEPGVSLLAWTTTPWTLPSNVALAVGPDLDYAYVRVGEETVIVAHALKPEGEVQKVVKGAELIGLRYEPPYRMGDPGGKHWQVVGADHVRTDSGTGIVHTAPAYGEDDFQLAKAEGLGLLALVGPDGRFVEAAPEWLRGVHFKAADKPIMAELKGRGLLYFQGMVRHSYPFSPRSSDDPLMQFARPGWFIRTSTSKERALENNATVNWLPEHIQDGRFGDFLRNNVDWALSRERFWGTPLPVWVCPACGAQEAFDSVSALERRGASGFDTNVDRHLQVHKPWIDRVTVPCAGCDGTMSRVTEVIDCWFDSGCMPFAQFGWPHHNHERFKAAFPADFISEAIDQTRGWFYSLMMISTLLFDDETCERFGLPAAGYPRPFKNCIVLGHVCDMEGKKESKSSGNYTSPDIVLRGRMKMRVVADASLQRGQVGMVKAAVRSIDLSKDERMSLCHEEFGARTLPVSLVAGPSRGKETVALHPSDMAELGITTHCWLIAPFDPPGADAFRWLFYASNPPWTNTRISLRGIREGQREFHLRLANVFQFFTIYATISRFDPENDTVALDQNVLDRWVLGELNQLVSTVSLELDRYRTYEAARAIAGFVDGLSNWYVRRSRSRFWGDGPDTRAALWTLHEVLSTLSRLIAPFVPFMAEAMYQRLGLPAESVHMTQWPSLRGVPLPEGGEALAADMALIRELASLGLAARSKVGVRVRQPLQAAEIILPDPNRGERLQPLLGLLKDELNVRFIHFTQEADRFVTFRLKPNFPRLGKTLGKDMKACAAALAAADPSQVRQALLIHGGWDVVLPGGVARLTGEDVVVEVQPREGFEAAGSATAVVVLHAELDDDLREEGLAREVMNRIQTGRKEADLGYTDRITVEIAGGAALVAAVQRFNTSLAEETLSLAIVCVVDEGAGDRVDEHPFALSITRVSRA
jgi:isoleucyl-tRNA synthetase